MSSSTVHSSSFMVILALLSIVRLADNAANFEAAEQRAIECCRQIDGPTPIDCSWGASTANMKRIYEAMKEIGLVGPNVPVSAEQKDKLKVIVTEGLPLARRIGAITSIGCISNWEDHTECCRNSNAPNACLHLCDFREVKHFYEQGDVEALANRSADIFGPMCWPHTDTLHKCAYAPAEVVELGSPPKSHIDEL